MFKKKKLIAADLFCGAGGTSSGLAIAAEALGIDIELTAINHWDTAVKTHSLNHPNARHLCTGIDEVNPFSLYDTAELDLLWGSPECTHHSTARGGAAMHDQSRASAWCLVRWAQALMPRYILVENVPEFKDWGPLNNDLRPIKKRKGETFQAWKAALESLGYRVDFRVITCADYGDPTTRRRIFVEAVRGKDKPIWPDATHSESNKNVLFPTQWNWRTAADIIDRSYKSQSIFLRKKPLAIKTVRRAWSGFIKHGLKSEEFIIPGKGAGIRAMDRPVQTICTESRGERFAKAYLLNVDHQSSSGGTQDTDTPVTTQTTKARTCLIDPYLLPQQAGGRDSHPVNEPVSTVTTTGATSLIEPCIIQPGHGSAQDMDDRSLPMTKPLPTTPCSNRFALIENNESALFPAETPCRKGYIRIQTKGGEYSEDIPLSHATSKEWVIKAADILNVCAERKIYPIITIGEASAVLDLHLRMLQPSELAEVQGFPKNYKFQGNKTETVKQIGNAVPGNTACALALALMTQNSQISHLVKKHFETQAA